MVKLTSKSKGHSRHHPRQSSSVVVSTTHLLYNPKRDDVRLAQAVLMMAGMLVLNNILIKWHHWPFSLLFISLIGRFSFNAFFSTVLIKSPFFITSSENSESFAVRNWLWSYHIYLFNRYFGCDRLGEWSSNESIALLFQHASEKVINRKLQRDRCLKQRRDCQPYMHLQEGRNLQ